MSTQVMMSSYTDDNKYPGSSIQGVMILEPLQIWIGHQRERIEQVLR